jgi:hemolysin D
LRRISDRLRVVLDKRERESRLRHAADFLPAALEVQETPPSRTARTLLWATVALVTAAILWACLGHVDVVAVAQGRIVPSGRVKLVQPLSTASVTAIHVRDGQRVKAGDLLIELDPTLPEAELRRTEAELDSARRELAREQAFVQHLQRAPTRLGDATSLRADERQLVQQRINENAAELRALDQAIIRRQAELVSIEQTIEKHRKTLPLVSERVESMKRLAAQNLVARTTYITAEEERIAAEQDLATQRANGDAVQAALRELVAQREQLTAGALSEAFGQISVLETRVAALQQEQVKATQIEAQQRLVAPADGTVQQLRVHTVGGVVTPAEPLLVIVPDSEALEIEAKVLNKDIGWVADGQAARVKLEAFPFTRYGVIEGAVIDVSNDAIVDEALGLVYAARVLLKRSHIRVDRRDVPLSPGMAVSVEIKTGTRRLIEYFLSPIRSHVDESLSER